MIIIIELMIEDIKW